MSLSSTQKITPINNDIFGNIYEQNPEILHTYVRVNIIIEIAKCIVLEEFKLV